MLMKTANNYPYKRVIVRGFGKQVGIRPGLKKGEKVPINKSLFPDFCPKGKTCKAYIHSYLFLHFQVHIQYD
jgi:hypothetical protein